MNAVFQPRQIIDRRQITAALDTVVGSSGDSGKRNTLLEEIKAAYKNGFAVIRERFNAGKFSGEDTVKAQS